MGAAGKIVIYTMRYCGYCQRAKRLLEHKGAKFTEVSVDANLELRRQLIDASGQRTVPQIWINNQHIGGCTDLINLDVSGKLDEMLQALK